MIGAIVYPHQLFDRHPVFKKAERVWIVESPRFFTDFAYHKKKLLFHRASMKHWAMRASKRVPVDYVNVTPEMPDVLLRKLKKAKIRTLLAVDPVDIVLQAELETLTEKIGAELEILDNPAFLNTQHSLERHFEGCKRYSMTSFYIDERKRRHMLCTGDKPAGGRWTFDTQNRKSLPRDENVPAVWRPSANAFVREAAIYVETHFADHPGEVSNFFYPVTPKDTERWLDDFLQRRFFKFGPYEDAICKDETFLFHSGLSPLLNSGLLLPEKVLDCALRYAEQNNVPMQSTEGFVRQISGWREYVRAMYVLESNQLRNGNYFSLSDRIPESFYTAKTGIEPVDNVLRHVLDNAYCHHIERLMVLGTFLQLCEIAPVAVYRWFMEMFVDAYDWVMVPNVYGMSQFAAGAMMMTKPYLCGSHYILKMSNFSRGPWCAIWDGLFWRFLFRHRAQLEPMIRLRMMLRQLDKMPKAMLKKHLGEADLFLASLL